MEETCALRELTNIPLSPRLIEQKDIVMPLGTAGCLDSPEQRPMLEDLLSISQKEIDFGFCLPGSIHQRSFILSIRQDLKQTTDMELTVFSEDEALCQSQSLVFGLKRPGQLQYYDNFRMKVRQRRNYEFVVGVRTPLFYEYSVESVVYIRLADYAPTAIVLRQKAQVPEVVCLRELYFEDQQRMIKLSYVQGRDKRQCRVPFRLNHQMATTLMAQLIGIDVETVPLVDVKPRSVTLTGKGQFALVFCVNLDQQVRNSLVAGKPRFVRRILTLRIKQTNFMYHFPVEVAYFPDPSRAPPAE